MVVWEGIILGYRIQYDNYGAARYRSRKVRRVNPWICLCGIILAVLALRYISGMDFKVTATALEDMAVNLQQGSGVQEAFSRFCLDVLQGAQIG